MLKGTSTLTKYCSTILPKTYLFCNSSHSSIVFQQRNYSRRKKDKQPKFHNNNTKRNKRSSNPNYRNTRNPYYQSYFNQFFYEDDPYNEPFFEEEFQIPPYMNNGYYRAPNGYYYYEEYDDDDDFNDYDELLEEDYSLENDKRLEGNILDILSRDRQVVREFGSTIFFVGDKTIEMKGDVIRQRAKFKGKGNEVGFCTYEVKLPAIHVKTNNYNGYNIARVVVENGNGKKWEIFRHNKQLDDVIIDAEYVIKS